MGVGSIFPGGVH